MAPGVNVIVGPNASGKSSIVRALRAVLYPDEKPGPATAAEAVFGTSHGELHALRLGSELDWQREGASVAPPPMPDYRFIDCFTLGVEDLLATEAGTDADIAARLSRALAGGYDIGAVRRAWPFAVKSTHGRQAGRDLDEARRERRRMEQAREALRSDEARLDELRRRKAEAEQAQAEAQRAAAAANLLDVRRERAGLAERLASYPEGMDRLRGDEAEELERLQQRADERSQSLKQAREARSEAERRLEATALEENSQLDQAALAEHRSRIEQLRTLESELAAKRSERQKAGARLNDAITSLGGAPERAVHIDPATLDAIDRELDGKRELEMAMGRLRQELDRLPAPDESEADLDALVAARSALMEWLTAPTPTRWSTGRWCAVSLGWAAGAVGIAAGTLWQEATAILLLPWAAGAVATIRWVRGPDQRAAARQRYDRQGLAAPVAWSQEGVAQRLDALDRELQRTREMVAQAERRREAESVLTSKQREHDELLDQLAERAAEIGFDLTLADKALDRWLRLTREYDEARRALIEADAEIERLSERAAALRAPVVAFLRDHGELDEGEDSGPERFAARLDSLAQRLDTLEKARRDREEAERSIARLAADRDEMRSAMAGIYERVRLTDGDATTLHERLAWLPEWRQVVDELNRARAREVERERALGNAPGWLEWVAADDAEAIERRQRELEEAAAGRDELLQEIERINQAIERAGHERWLERARAEEQAAEEALRDRLDEALFADAGDYLLGQVAAEHSRSSQPAALAQAQDWFAAFTHHAYRLELGAGDEGSFSAVDNTTGERRRLTELSSGTRMQLLMSVRIAFALEAEQGAEPLPLVLDEALTTADPERFRAAVASLRQLADHGRQVFYLTAQPSDIAYWREADPDVHWVDLARMRQQAAAVASPEAIALPQGPTIPEPGDESPEAYAVRLGVPALDPWADAGKIPVFYLLRDDLPLLRRLLAMHIDTLGALASYLDARAAARLLDDGERQRLRGRVAGARAWLHAWRVGRGFPVDREALAASGAFKATFFERVAALNDEVGGDPQRLIAELAKGEVKGSRRQDREELTEWLSANGYLDERAMLSRGELLQEVVDAMVDWTPDRDTAITEARRLRDSLIAAIGEDDRDEAQPALL